MITIPLMITTRRCGLVGYLGFELKAECGGARAHASPSPDAAMFFAGASACLTKSVLSLQMIDRLID